MKVLVLLSFFTLVACCAARNLSPKIIGGQFAAKNQFPHQVAIIYGGSLRCGGSIYNENWIITAAHCLGSNLSILAGTNSLKNGGIARKVIKGIPNEKYGNFMNDIALLRLEKPLKFGSSVWPIDLLTEEVPTGGEVYISGWGRTEGGVISERLKFNKLAATSREVCARVIDHPGLICLGHSKGNGACNGDSGGSAMYGGKLCGVANFVSNGCGSTNPDGYAKISYYVDWIKETIAKYEQESNKSFMKI